MNIYDYTLNELEEYFASINDKKFRATQLFEWLYRVKINSFDDITNMKKELIERLKSDFEIKPLELVERQISSDGTNKFLFRLYDDNLIETVLMNNEYGYSICVTTQVGCNMGCLFCASGLRGRVRNLTKGEITLQILMAERIANIKVSSVVVMGIGEPFDNYDNVMDFVKIINNPKGLEIGARHITISTSGLIEGIKKYSNEPLQTNLAISLHASNNETRSRLMKINKVYNIESLINEVKEYINKTNRRVTIEYILLDGINDSINNANELADLLRGMNVYVNLIPYNTVSENGLRRSENVNEFYNALKKRKINVTKRREQGHDIDAACGQLRSKKIKENL